MHKILWLTDNYYPTKGGMAESCDRITYNLRQAGVYIEIVHFHKKQRPLKDTSLVRGRYSPCLVFPDPEHAMSLFWHKNEQRLLKEAFTHVVVFGGSFAMTSGPIFAAWLNAKLITCLRGNDFDLSIFSAKRQSLLLSTLQRSDAVCSVTNEKAKKVAALFPGKGSHWTPNGIDQTLWVPIAEEREKARALISESGEKFRIGLFGHLKQKKGLDFLLSIIYRKRLHDKVHLLLVGTLDEEHLLQLQEKEISFTLIPFMQRYELIPYYLSCDLIGIPSFYEGMPNVLLEGGALGIPFWCSTAGGMGDVLTHEKEAFLFEPGDFNGAKNALLHALDMKKEDLKSMGTALKNLITETYTIGNETNKYIQILNEMRNV